LWHIRSSTDFLLCIWRISQLWVCSLPSYFEIPCPLFSSSHLLQRMQPPQLRVKSLTIYTSRKT
jgi:hypothetical protein